MITCRGPKRTLWRLLRRLSEHGGSVESLARELGVNSGLIWMSRRRGATMSPKLERALIAAGYYTPCRRKYARLVTRQLPPDVDDWTQRHGTERATQLYIWAVRDCMRREDIAAERAALTKGVNE